MGRRCGRLRELGANPAICVDKLRPHTQRIWQQFSEEENRQFCTRHAARWNVMRHRVAEQNPARVESDTLNLSWPEAGRHTSACASSPNGRAPEQPTYL
jgi:uncharacterized NAD(P)/FAD-binding protein YdhS